jgi:uncharacterized membrane-anchored protein YjiN (DUF445 family)
VQDLFQSDLSWLNAKETAPAAVKPGVKSTAKTKLVGAVKVKISYKHTEASINRMREAHLLRHQTYIMSEETKAKLREKRKSFKHSEETKQKLAEASRRRGQTEATKQKLRELNYKPIHTPNGVFPSRTALAQRIQQDLGLNSLNYALKKVSFWCKKYPKHYYYIK